jgi:hypothetical protein
LGITDGKIGILSRKLPLPKYNNEPKTLSKVRSMPMIA